MDAKQTIRKVLFIGLWVCIGGGMLTLLLAAIRNKNNETCKGYTITIKGGEKNRFIDEKDIETIILKTGNGKIKGQAIDAINLNKMEKELGGSVWVSRAETYFDNQDILHVAVTEKEPIARIFSTDGNSFYIDSAASRLPLSDKLSARVPVFTGYINGSKWNKKDSLLMKEIKQLASYIQRDEFWMAQIAQVDVAADGTMEMIPVVGNHLIKFGNGNNIAEKFRRLLIFYQQVLSKTGFDKYKVIDVQYQGQIVVSKSNNISKTDSVQLKRNIDKMMQDARRSDADTINRPMIIKEKYDIPADTAREEKPELPAEEIKTEIKKAEAPKAEQQVPKTLMPKKNVNN